MKWKEKKHIVFAVIFWALECIVDCKRAFISSCLLLYSFSQMECLLKSVQIISSHRKYSFDCFNKKLQNDAFRLELTRNLKMKSTLNQIDNTIYSANNPPSQPMFTCIIPYIYTAHNHIEIYITYRLMYWMIHNNNHHHHHKHRMKQSMKEANKRINSPARLPRIWIKIVSIARNVTDSACAYANLCVAPTS